MSEENKNSPHLPVSGKTKSGDFYDYDKDSSLADIFLLLKKSAWQQAQSLCDEFIKKDPQCAEAYFGKLMCEYKLRSKEDFAKMEEPFDSSENYAKIIQYGREELVRPLQKYLLEIYENIYSDALNIMQTASEENDFFQAANLFKLIPNYNDASHLISQCEKKCEEIHKDSIYNRAVNRLQYAETWLPSDTTIQAYEASVAELKTIPDWKDAQERLAMYQATLYDIKVRADKNRDIRLKAEKKKKKSRRKKAIIISLVSSVVLIGLMVSGAILLKPEIHYHTITLDTSSENCENLYMKLSKFRGFAPVDKVLKKFVWLPSERIDIPSGSFVITRMTFDYTVSPELIEGKADSFFSFGKYSEKTKWKTVNVDTDIEKIYDKDALLSEERTKTDGSVAVTMFQYDENGNCTREEHTDAKGNTSTVIHRYNENGIVTKSVSTDKNNRESEHTYEYDSRNFITKETITNHKGKVTTINYTLDSDGNHLKETTVYENGKSDIVEFKDYELYYLGK